MATCPLDEQVTALLERTVVSWVQLEGASAYTIQRENVGGARTTVGTAGPGGQLHRSAQQLRPVADLPGGDRRRSVRPLHQPVRHHHEPQGRYRHTGLCYWTATPTWFRGEVHLSALLARQHPGWCFGAGVSPGRIIDGRRPVSTTRRSRDCPVDLISSRTTVLPARRTRVSGTPASRLSGPAPRRTAADWP